MKPFSIAALGVALLFASFVTDGAAAQGQTHRDEARLLTAKLNAYIGCINRLSQRAYQSRSRYFSWASKKGPTGRERIIYGTYTIYDTSGCKQNVEKANTLAPHDAALEAAGTAYADTVGKLAPLLKEADDYYTQQDYKDDRMAKGKAMHPRLVAAWDAFANADRALRHEVEAINDKRALAQLAEIEKSEGRQSRYYIHATMIHAKRVLHAEKSAKPDLAAIKQALAEYEATVKAAEQLSGDGPKIGSMFMSNAKSYLVTAKRLMRRMRDHVPYSSGDKMMLRAGSGWMVEGSPPRLSRDYNQLVGAYNRGGRF